MVKERATKTGLEPNPTEKRNVRYAYRNGERVAKIWEVWRTDTEEKVTVYHKQLGTGAVMSGAENFIKRYDDVREE